MPDIPRDNIEEPNKLSLTAMASSSLSWNSHGKMVICDVWDEHRSVCAKDEL